jgi:hypothetical protein
MPASSAEAIVDGISWVTRDFIFNCDEGVLIMTLPIIFSHPQEENAGQSSLPQGSS